MQAVWNGGPPSADVSWCWGPVILKHPLSTPVRPPNINIYLCHLGSSHPSDDALGGEKFQLLSIAISQPWFDFPLVLKCFLVVFVALLALEYQRRAESLASGATVCLVLLWWRRGHWIRRTLLYHAPRLRRTLPAASAAVPILHKCW